MGRLQPEKSISDAMISIHPSRVGWDRRRRRAQMHAAAFQSTHPVWDGTRRESNRMHAGKHFNPPIPCGMGRLRWRRNREWCCISIHPSRVGWDFDRSHSRTWRKLFQSTHPVWDGTSSTYKVQKSIKFQSTHPVWDGTAKNI